MLDEIETASKFLHFFMCGGTVTRSPWSPDLNRVGFSSLDTFLEDFAQNASTNKETNFTRDPYVIPERS